MHYAIKSVMTYTSPIFT